MNIRLIIIKDDENEIIRNYEFEASEYYSLDWEKQIPEMIDQLKNKDERF